ncbi:hypothetical protein [Burkholderia sp. SCN-KJ]|nr:hypothetical protein [Burkholderia sp. SCN-KJ]MCR4466971.1 hypothetical protein [Burkholderia sp. SCN-KJ]
MPNTFHRVGDGPLFPMNETPLALVAAMEAFLLDTAADRAPGA